MTRTAVTLAVVFTVCLFAEAQPPTPVPPVIPDAPLKPPTSPGTLPPLPVEKPSVEPDPFVRRLNEEEAKIHAKQQELTQRLAAIAVEKDKAKKRPVGDIQAKVEGLLYDTDNEARYILGRNEEGREWRVYLGDISGTLSTMISKRALRGKAVIASGQLTIYPPDPKAGIPAGTMWLIVKDIASIPELPQGLPGVSDLPPIPSK